MKHTNTPRMAQTAQIVGVIASAEDAKFASRHPDAADIYELRLDKLWLTPWIKKMIQSLRARGKRIILTVRDPREGGAKKHWDFMHRMKVLRSYLHLGDIIDVEASNLKASGKKYVRKMIGKRRIKLLASFHSMLFYPSYFKLRQAFEFAVRAGAQFLKIVVRLTNVGMMFKFKEHIDALSPAFPSLRVVPMGTGELGEKSRVAFSRIAPFAYGYLANPVAPGQPHVRDLRRKMTELSSMVFA